MISDYASLAEKHGISQEQIEAQTPTTIAEFGYGLARAIQPEHFLETGTGIGALTAFLLNGLARNEKGVLWTVESDTRLADFTNEHLMATGEVLPGGAHFDPRIVYEDSTTWEPPDEVVFDICWFDTGRHEEELAHYQPWMSGQTVIVFRGFEGSLSSEASWIRLPVAGELLCLGKILS